MPVTGTRRSRYPRPPCPHCGYDDQVVRISYGLPSTETIEQAKRGEIALGGSCLGPDSPGWYCRGCMRSFEAPNFVAVDAGS